MSVRVRLPVVALWYLWAMSTILVYTLMSLLAHSHAAAKAPLIGSALAVWIVLTVLAAVMAFSAPDLTARAIVLHPRRRPWTMDQTLALVALIISVIGVGLTAAAVLGT